MKTFQIFQNKDEYGEMVVPSDKLEEIKRRSVNQNLNNDASKQLTNKAWF